MNKRQILSKNRCSLTDFVCLIVPLTCKLHDAVNQTGFMVHCTVHPRATSMVYLMSPIGVQYCPLKVIVPCVSLLPGAFKDHIRLLTASKIYTQMDNQMPEYKLDGTHDAGNSQAFIRQSDD